MLSVQPVAVAWRVALTHAPTVRHNCRRDALYISTLR